MRDDKKSSALYLSWMDAFTFAACAGGIGARALGRLCLKVLIMTFDGKAVSCGRAEPYAFLGGMITTILLQTAYLNKVP